MSASLRFTVTLGAYVPSSDDQLPHVLTDLGGDRWVLCQVRGDSPDAFYNIMPLQGQTLWTPMSLSSIELAYGPVGRQQFIHLASDGPVVDSRACWRCQTFGFVDTSCVVCLACQGAHRLTGCPQCDATDQRLESEVTVIETPAARTDGSA